jgi:hypothetical protein
MIDQLLFHLLKIQCRLMTVTAKALGRRLPGPLPVHTPVKIDPAEMQAYEEMARDHERSSGAWREKDELPIELPIDPLHIGVNQTGGRTIWPWREPQ